MAERSDGKGRSRFGLSDEDATLFRQAVKGARPIDRTRKIMAPVRVAGAGRGAAPYKGPIRRDNGGRPTPPEMPAARVKNAPGADSVDRRTAQRFRRGQIPVEGRLDLHGCTQEEAHRKLEQFLARALADGKRCIVIVTGRGLFREGGGVLRKRVPEWLAQPPFKAHVLATARARPEHGGEGALSVLLRRGRA